MQPSPCGHPIDHDRPSLVPYSIASPSPPHTVQGSRLSQGHAGSLSGPCPAVTYAPETQAHILKSLEPRVDKLKRDGLARLAHYLLAKLDLESLETAQRYMDVIERGPPKARRRP